jgi:hypothetical protein
VTPEELLAGPRGRRVCWELRAVDELSDAAILAAFARSVDDAMYWQEPHGEDLALASRDVCSTLLPVAEALCASAATDWWSRPAALDGQHLVAFDGIPGPILTGVRGRLGDSFAAAPHSAPPSGVDWRTCSAQWWSAPITLPSVVTTRSLAGFGSVRLWLVEDSMGWEAATEWPVTVLRTPRLYEITAAADWIELVRRYPFDVSVAKRGDWWRTTGRDGRWLMPDWPAVGNDYDAVHVTALAYLSCAGVALDVEVEVEDEDEDEDEDEAATLLAGWDPDVTFWLDDIVQFAGPPVCWRRDRENWTWRPVDQ